MQDISHQNQPSPRKIEILEKVRKIFAEKGFDGASMQDLARAAGMSAGNFYRYFPSKNAIIEAIVEQKLTEIDQTFAEIMQASDPVSVFRHSLYARLASFDTEEDNAIWAEIEAASSRRAEIAEIAGRIQESAMRNLLIAFAHIAGTSIDDAEKRFAPHAAMVILLVKGAAVSACSPCKMEKTQADQAHFEALVLRVIDLVLSEVTGRAAQTLSAQV